MKKYSICEQCEHYKIFSEDSIGNCTHPLNLHFVDGRTGKKRWRKGVYQLNYKANCKKFKQKSFKNEPKKIESDIIKNKFELMDI